MRPQRRSGALASVLWAAVAGLLFAQAYLVHGAFAWAGALALGLAVQGLEGPGLAKAIAGRLALVHALVGLSAWGFVHHGVAVFAAQVLYLAAAGALVGVVAAAGSTGRLAPWRLALAWTAVAWARELGPVAFPLLLGGTQAPLVTGAALSVVGAAALGGMLVGVGLAVVRAVLGPATGAAEAADPRSGLKPPLPPISSALRRSSSALSWVVGLGLAVLVGAVAPGGRAAGEPLRVRIVQGSVPSWLYGASNGSLVAQELVRERYLRLSAEALASPVDVVLMPESALKSPIEIRRGRASTPLFGLPPGGAPEGAEVVTGAYVERVAGGGERMVGLNAALLLSADDPERVLTEVSKRQLAPLAEAWLTAGTGDGLLRLGDGAGGAVLGALICFESMFPRLGRALAAEAGVLVVLTNDAAFEASPPALTHAEQGWARALETGRPLVRAAQSGISLAVDGRGRLLGELGSFETGVLEVEVQPMVGQTWFCRAGYLLGPASAVGALAAAGLAGWRRRKSSSTTRTTA